MELRYQTPLTLTPFRRRRWLLCECSVKEANTSASTTPDSEYGRDRTIMVRVVDKRERRKTARVSELMRGGKKPLSTMMHDHVNSIATEYDDALSCK